METVPLDNQPFGRFASFLVMAEERYQACSRLKSRLAQNPTADPERLLGEAFRDFPVPSVGLSSSAPIDGDRHAPSRS